MAVSARSLRTSAMVTVSAAVLALTPSVVPPLAKPVDPAAVRLTSSAALFGADLMDAALATESIGTQIEAIYNTVEPWLAYDVNLLSWAVGWVPVAGLLAPQMIYFYDLGASITQSLVFNTADLIDGTVSVSEALSNINTATTDAFNAFVSTETGWIDSMLPPSLPAEVDPGLLADVGTLFGLLT